MIAICQVQGVPIILLFIELYLINYFLFSTRSEIIFLSGIYKGVEVFLKSYSNLHNWAIFFLIHKNRNILYFLNRSGIKNHCEFIRVFAPIWNSFLLWFIVLFYNYVACKPIFCSYLIGRVTVHNFSIIFRSF